MTLLNARKRLVVFRLTEDEYNKLKGACSERGARNLSEFTRSELLSRIHSDLPSSELDERLSGMERRLCEMQELIKDVAQRLELHPSEHPIRSTDDLSFGTETEP